MDYNNMLDSLGSVDWVDFPEAAEHQKQMEEKIIVDEDADIDYHNDNDLYSLQCS